MVLLAALTGLLAASPSQVIASTAVHDQSVPAPPTAQSGTAQSAATTTVAASAPAVEAFDDDDQFTAFDALLLGLAVLSLGLIWRRRWWSLADAPRQPELFQPAIALTLILMMFVLGRIAVMLVADRAGIDIAAGPPRTLPDRVKLTAGVYFAKALIVVIFAWRCFTARAPIPDQRMGSLHAAGIAIASLVLAWPVVAAVGGLAGLLVSVFRDEPVGRIAHQTLKLLSEGDRLDSWHMAMGALVVLATPIIEEVMYRGLLQRTIVSVGIQRWPAIIITSVLFALMHIDAAQPHAVIALFVLSLVFGWAYERTGRLLAPIVMHGLFNAGNLALGLLG
jgi:membrane protease YdiL (CAAX protease family)